MTFSCQRGCKCCSTSSSKTMPVIFSGSSVRPYISLRPIRSNTKIIVDLYPSPRLSNSLLPQGPLTSMYWFSVNWTNVLFDSLLFLLSCLRQAKVFLGIREIARMSFRARAILVLPGIAAIDTLSKSQRAIPGKLLLSSACFRFTSRW